MYFQYVALKTGNKWASYAKPGCPEERTVNNKKPGHAPGEMLLQERREKTDSQGEPTTENFAEHLTRVTPNADSSKALLKARYKALHHPEDDHADDSH